MFIHKGLWSSVLSQQAGAYYLYSVISLLCKQIPGAIDSIKHTEIDKDANAKDLVIKYYSTF